LETLRCFLVRLTNDYFEDVKKLYVNEMVRRYLGGRIPEEHTATKFKDTLNRSHKDSHVWVIRVKEINQSIGLVSLDQHVDGGTEVSYEFLPICWGKGYATEVISHIINFAFKDLKIIKVLAETQTANVPSCRLLERIGMELERKIQRFGEEQSLYSIEAIGSN
jgi:ribosomal-protein-alanine N-acetyltransferase